MATIKIDKVRKCFGNVEVLKEFNQVFEDKEFVTLLGPSGCGKTTMLRMLAGFEKPTSGTITVDDKVVSSDKTFVPPEKRDIGMVFQSYAVWPHMTVFDNIAYPLKIKKMPKEEIKKKVEEMKKKIKDAKQDPYFHKITPWENLNSVDEMKREFLLCLGSLSSLYKMMGGNIARTKITGESLIIRCQMLEYFIAKGEKDQKMIDLFKDKNYEELLQIIERG